MFMEMDSLRIAYDEATRECIDALSKCQELPQVCAVADVYGWNAVFAAFMYLNPDRYNYLVERLKNDLFEQLLEAYGSTF